MALSEFAKEKGQYIIPKKGSPEYNRVKEIQSELQEGPAVGAGSNLKNPEPLVKKMKKSKSKLVKLQAYNPELDVVEGSGFIKNRFIGLVKKVNNTVDKNLESALGDVPLEPSEMHAKKLVTENGIVKRLNYNYAGPGTNLESRLSRNIKPIDGIDDAARTHDIDYTENFQKKMKQGIKVTKDEVQAADKKFVDKVKLHKKDNPAFAAVIPPLFAAKKLAEDTRVLSYTSFFDPAKSGSGLLEFRIKNTRRDI